MEIPKPAEADKEFFRSVLPGDPEVEVKPMFGNLGAFVHGNMFAGLFGRAIGVRSAESDHQLGTANSLGRPTARAAPGYAVSPFKCGSL